MKELESASLIRFLVLFLFLSSLELGMGLSAQRLSPTIQMTSRRNRQSYTSSTRSMNTQYFTLCEATTNSEELSYDEKSGSSLPFFLLDSDWSDNSDSPAADGSAKAESWETLEDLAVRDYQNIDWQEISSKMCDTWDSKQVQSLRAESVKLMRKFVTTAKDAATRSAELRPMTVQDQVALARLFEVVENKNVVMLDEDDELQEILRVAQEAEDFLAANAIARDGDE